MSKRWTRATTDSIYPDSQFKVTDLLEGCEYEFRVAAENEIGTGDFSPPSKPVFAKDPIGIVQRHFHMCHIIKVILDQLLSFSDSLK